MIVYIVWKDCFTDRSIGKIFSKFEDAVEYVDMLELDKQAIGEDIYIEPYNVE